jgi:hypothetical protein
MAKRLTVFYSWQSDSPASLNRTFIEKALREALKQLNTDATVENALRETTLTLDKDTQDVAGSPPIAETILRKIEECSVFVADFSFVGCSKAGFTNASGNPRQFPNPNVLMEYGYALRCHSHARLVGIMNTAYGNPDAELLPFDLRHLRWPITYHLPDEGAGDKKEQLAQLVKTLVKAIGLILSTQLPPCTAAEKFVPQKATSNPALFFENPADLLGDRSDTFAIPDGGKAYLRLYPSAIVPAIPSESEARELMRIGNLAPLGRVESGYGFDRNLFGAICFEVTDGKMYHLSQVFLSREIWGIDARILDADYLKQRQISWGHPPCAYIASGYIEDFFVKGLTNYLMFARTHLKLLPPLHVRAGVVGVKGYPIAVDNGGFIGKSLRDGFEWEGEIGGYQIPQVDILEPFFERVWTNCGIQRTQQNRAALIKRYGG